MTVCYPTLPEGVCIKPIPGHLGYWASSDGRVWSQYRTGISKPGDILRELKAVPSKKSGHLRISLAASSKSLYLVHRLILETFAGPCPEGMECCHDPDPDPANCRLENLRWDTRQANHDDKCRAGRQARGAKGGRAKLTDEQAGEIRLLVASGVSRREIARRFKINRVSVDYLVSGKNWKHMIWPPPIPTRTPLTELQAATIINLGRAKMKHRAIADKVGTSPANVSLILLGKSWRRLHENDRWKLVLAMQDDPHFSP